MAGMASRRRSAHGRRGRRRGAFSQALHPRQWPPIVSALIRGQGTLRLGLALAVVGGVWRMPAMANGSAPGLGLGAEGTLGLGLALAVVGGLGSMPAMANVSPRAVVVGAEVLLAGGFAGLAGK